MRTKQALNLWESLGKTLKRIDKHNAHKIDVDSALQLCRELYTELLTFEECNESQTETGNEIAEETKTQEKIQEAAETIPSAMDESIEPEMTEPEYEEESIDSSVMFESKNDEIEEQIEETINNTHEPENTIPVETSEVDEINSETTPETEVKVPVAEVIPEPISVSNTESIPEPIAKPEPAFITEVTPEPIPEPEPEPVSVQTQVNETNTNNAPQPSLFGNDSKPIQSLGESLGRNIVSKNETMASKEANDLASKFQAKPVTDIKAAISLGDRFLFIKELFNGNADDFNQTIQQLNNKNSIEDARVLLSNRNWDADNDTVKYFHSIIQRKYISN